MNFHVCRVKVCEKQLRGIKKLLLKNLKLLWFPYLKVEDTIDGIINKIENGLEIPPVR